MAGRKATALACLLAAFVLGATPWMRALDSDLYALAMASTARPEPHPRVFVVAKDDVSWSHAPGGRFGRAVFAGAVETATRCGASVVGLDFLFDARKPEEDARLEEAVRGRLPVVAASEEQGTRSLVAGGEPAGIEAGGGPPALTRTIGPHPGLLPWVTEGFINIGRARNVKAPALWVELYRPGDPPVAGFAFATWLALTVEDALAGRPPGPPPPADEAPEAAWDAWLAAARSEATGAGPRLEDPAMERLLVRAELAGLLHRHGRDQAPARLTRLETRVPPGGLLPVRFPAGRPTRRVHWIDYAGRRGSFPSRPLYLLANPEEADLLVGAAEVALEAGRTRTIEAGDLGDGTARAGTGGASLEAALTGPAAPGVGTRVLAVSRSDGRVVEGRPGPDGRVELPGLAPGRADLFVLAGLGGEAGLRTTMLVEGVPVPGPRLELVLPAADRELWLTGTPGARVGLEAAGLAAGGPARGSVRGTATFGPDGVLKLQVPAGEYAVVEEAPGGSEGPPLFVEAGVAGEPARPPRRPPGAARAGLRNRSGRELILLRVPTGEETRVPAGADAVDLPPDRYLVLADLAGGAGRQAWQPGRGMFRDQALLVGTTMESDQDSFPTPVDFGADRDMPGIEVHANVLSNLLSGRQLVPVGSLAELLGGAVLLGLIGLACTSLAPTPAALLSALALAGYAGLAAALLAGPGWILPMAPNLGAGAIFWATELVRHLLFARRETAHIREVFGKCVDPVLRDRLLSSPDLVLKGEKREVTVMFSDARGFTSLSETLSPEQMLEVLNSYFGRVTPIFLAHGGVFDKYIGDAFMGFFGAPLPQPDHAERALKAALAMLAEHGRWKAERQRKGLPSFDVGFGINTGIAVAGAIGSESSRVNYSVLGDAVNVAARLESLCKDHHAQILVSGSTRAAQPAGGPALEDLGEVQVKGRREPVRVYKAG